LAGAPIRWGTGSRSIGAPIFFPRSDRSFEQRLCFFRVASLAQHYRLLAPTEDDIEEEALRRQISRVIVKVLTVQLDLEQRREGADTIALYDPEQLR
jgi:hypothetical protein